MSCNLLPPSQSCWWSVNIAEFKFPLAFTKKRKKIDRFDNLPQFHWEDISCQDVVGQGTYGAVFISRYRPEESKPAETVVINPAFRDSPF